MKVEDLQDSPDRTKTFLQIVSSAGFSTEVYPVTTSDGYKLQLFRIKSPNFKKGSKVVFLQHGLLDSADCWIVNTQQNTAAFQLVRAGFDVWLGNTRGNKYSIGHTKLNTKEEKYW
jgi:pimeloyl-ACP methyl ester carboxylesterase